MANRARTRARSLATVFVLELVDAVFRIRFEHEHRFAERARAGRRARAIGCNGGPVVRFLEWIVNSRSPLIRVVTTHADNLEFPRTGSHAGSESPEVIAGG